MAARPTNIIILGVTGDLTAKKIMPALFNLWKKGALPGNANVIGFGRRELDTEAFRKYSKELLDKKLEVSAGDFAEFSKRLSYVQGQFDDAGAYQRLNVHLSHLEAGNDEWQRLFYLAVPPEIYETIFTNLDKTGLGHGGEAKVDTKILVEKPFGKDQETAEQLDKLLGSLYQEHQIYRIDHYLAKEMIQNILTFRFSNDMFERIWDNRSIARIEIRTWETLGVEGRGAFYDGVGTLRDVGQNHLLQMLALVTMDAPLDYSSQAVQLKRAQLLATLKPLTADAIRNETYRAQYEGFRAIDGVSKDSQTETFFKIKAELSHPRWQGVPIYMEAGKRLATQVKDVVVTFDTMDGTIKPEGARYTNRVIFSLEPEESIRVEFWAKKPGLESDMEMRTLDFMLRDNSARTQYVEEYEKLLLDAVRGDQTLFVSTAEVNAMWAFVDPIVDAWKKKEVPLATYKPDTSPEVHDF